MGNSQSGCSYTNQGERIDDKKQEIGNILESARNFKNSTYNDIDIYFSNLNSLYGSSNTNDYYKKNPAYYYNNPSISTLNDESIKNLVTKSGDKYNLNMSSLTEYDPYKFNIK